MRKFIITLMICIFSVIINVDAYELKSNVIVIDPGHGGMDVGASIGNVYESDLVLEISFKIKEVLEKNGYFVILTRENKNSLCEGKFVKREDMNKRINIINNVNPRLVLSIHLNKFRLEKYRGAQVFYSNVNEENKRIAEELQCNFKNYLNNTNRLSVERENLYLLNKINVPCCLIECGFMSNTEEFKLLQEDNYQYKIAEVILISIRNIII